MTFLVISLIILIGKVKDLKIGIRNSWKEVSKNLKSKVICKEEFLTNF